MKRLLSAVPLIFITALSTAAEIRWDPHSLRLVQRSSVYGRMIRVSDDALLCSFEMNGKSYVRRSEDNGSSWGPAKLVAEFPGGLAANPEMLRLADGGILFLYNERPHTAGRPFGIALTRIDDHGTTVTAPRTLYQTVEGCWEPVAVQLPNGELQLFFANEGLFPETHEQEISMMRSHDGGETWEPPRRVAFRSGHRDGMPVPLVLRGQNELVLAIEDEGINGLFKPVIVATQIKNNWNDGYIDGASSHRWSALAEPLPPEVYAGAPYIVQLPCGTTVLSCQSTEGGRNESGAVMVVYTGSDKARDFGNRTVPFHVPQETGAKWNSLFVKAPHRVTAITSTVINGTWGIWTIEGDVLCCGDASL